VGRLSAGLGTTAGGEASGALSTGSLRGVVTGAGRTSGSAIDGASGRALGDAAAEPRAWVAGAGRPFAAVFTGGPGGGSGA